MILINNPSISRFPFLCRPGAHPTAPQYTCRIFPFDSLIKAQQFAQEDGIVIAEHCLVIRFVGVVDRPTWPVSINSLEEMEDFMNEAALWLAKEWTKAAVLPVRLLPFSFGNACMKPKLGAYPAL